MKYFSKNYFATRLIIITLLSAGILWGCTSAGPSNDVIVKDVNDFFKSDVECMETMGFKIFDANDIIGKKSEGLKCEVLVNVTGVMKDKEPLLRRFGPCGFTYRTVFQGNKFSVELNLVYEKYDTGWRLTGVN